MVGTAGAMTGLVKTPSSKSIRQKSSVFSSGPMITGMMGVSVGPMSKPSERKPVARRRVLAPQLLAPLRLLLQDLERRQHGPPRAGGMEAVKISGAGVVLEVVDDRFRRPRRSRRSRRSDLLKVPLMRSTSSDRPKCSAAPAPVGADARPGECASSTSERAPRTCAPAARGPARRRCRPPCRRRRRPRSAGRPAFEPALELPLEVRDVVVVEALPSRRRTSWQPSTMRGVVELVDEDDVVPADQAGDECRGWSGSRSRRRGTPPCPGTRRASASSFSCRSRVPFRKRLPVQPVP